jgi:hypothetical protein
MLKSTTIRLVSLLMFVATLGGTGVSFAQDNRAAQAAVLISQIELAVDNMKREFGQRVLKERKAELYSAGHGEETIGEAWNRHLTAAGVPKTGRTD